MQNAETVLGVLRERGRKGLPLDELYRQLFNPQLYLLAYGRIYANHGAMTPGADGETADGMSLAGIGRIIGALRHERYRFQPVKRTWIPKKRNTGSWPSSSACWTDPAACSRATRPVSSSRCSPMHGHPTGVFDRMFPGCTTSCRVRMCCWPSDRLRVCCWRAVQLPY